MNRYFFRLKLISDFVLAFVTLAAIAVCQEGCTPRVMAPKDQELITVFYAHRQAFEQLQEMAAEDARRGWYLGASKPSTLDQSRWSEYNNLRAQIRPGLEMAMNGTTGIIRFIFANKGVAIGPGWAKGIEYVPGDYMREGVLLPDLNKAASLPANVYIREIEPRWIIFYQRDE